MAKKELTNNEHKSKVVAEIKELEVKVAALKETLEPADAVKYTRLAECNALAKKQQA